MKVKQVFSLSRRSSAHHISLGGKQKLIPKKSLIVYKLSRELKVMRTLKIGESARTQLPCVEQKCRTRVCFMRCACTPRASYSNTNVSIKPNLHFSSLVVRLYVRFIRTITIIIAIIGLQLKTPHDRVCQCVLCFALNQIGSASISI